MARPWPCEAGPRPRKKSLGLAARTGDAVGGAWRRPRLHASGRLAARWCAVGRGLTRGTTGSGWPGRCAAEGLPALVGRGRHAREAADGRVAGLHAVGAAVRASRPWGWVANRRRRAPTGLPCSEVAGAEEGRGWHQRPRRGDGRARRAVTQDRLGHVLITCCESSTGL